MSIIQQLLRSIASLTYGFVTLLLFIYYAYRDSSLFKTSTEKEKNELALAQDRLWDLSKHPDGLTHAFYTLENGKRLHYVHVDDLSNQPSTAIRKNLIIFLHGFPDSWALWRRLLSSSALRHNSVLVAVDLPGYGGSDSLANYGATEVLEVVTEFVLGLRSKYGIDSEQSTASVEPKWGVILVGHDWGFVIGSRLAAEAPQLADRFILSNAFVPALTLANIDRTVSSSSKMLKTFVHHPLSSRNLPPKALHTLSPVFAQLQKSGYAFVFNLPLPLVSMAGSMGNFWLLRYCHQVAAGEDHPFDNAYAAEAMASSQGPGVDMSKTLTDTQESYPEAVKRRSPSGGFTEKIRYYREGLFSDRWVKSLETLAALYALEETRRSSSGAGLFDQPKGSLQAKTTILWGMLDHAVDHRIALQGIGEYLPKGSQVVVLPRTGHWTPTQDAGREAFEKVIEWAAGEEKGSLGHMVSEVYEGARVSIDK